MLLRIQPAAARRSGLTLIELLVVLFVALVLLGLIVPGIQSMRESARRTQCLNNLQNLGLAIQNFASIHNGDLPYLDEAGYNWPVSLLPLLDRGDIAGVPAYYNAVPLRVFTCPDDANNFGAPSGLSYGANGGYGEFPRAGNGPDTRGTSGASGGSTANKMSVIEAAAIVGNFGCHSGYDFGWVSGGLYPATCPPAADLTTTGARDAEVAHDTGVFWRDLSSYANCPYSNDRFRMSLKRITSRDGLGETLLLIENHNARNWGAGVAGNVSYGRLGSSPTASAVLDSAVVVHRPDLIFGDPRRRLAITGNVSDPISRINSNRACTPGRSPFASSSHPGLVTVVFCDGRARALSENILFSVYASLLTPGGSRHGQLVIGCCESDEER